MYGAQAYRQYAHTQITTADRGDLVVMLYEGAIRFLYRASAALREDRKEEAHINLLRAQDIVVELMGTLNLDAGELAYNLFRLYEYMHYRLVQANIRKDAEGAEEVMSLLKDLLPAWQQVARETRSGRSEARVLAAGHAAQAAARI